MARSAKKNSVNLSASGLAIPDWKLVDPEAKPVTHKGMKKDYDRFIKEACSYIHTEVDSKKVTAEFIKYCAKTFDKADAELLKRLGDHRFVAIGKFTYMMSRGSKLSAEHLDSIKEYYDRFVDMAKELEPVKTKTVKVTGPVISIQDRMREQVAELLGNWEGYLDDWRAGEYDISKFDPYKEMQYHQPGIKPAHAKIIQDAFKSGLEEAREVFAFEDEDIKEAYVHFTARKTERKKFLDFYEKIHTATETLINAGKATRKTRVKKSVSKDKLISKLKFKESESSIGVASINPVSILDSSELWVYNTKNRKLIHFVADKLQGPLSVKGTTIIGFDVINSKQRTVRKPEILKGSGNLARTKFEKLYKELTTTEIAANGRINEHCVIIKVF